MTNPLYTIETLPTTDQAAIREFNDRYIACIGATPPPSWSDLGDMFPTGSPMVTFPVSSLALKYQQTEGDGRFKTLLSKSFDVKTQEFDTGIEARLLDLLTHVFAYRQWTEGPARMLIAEARNRNRQIAALLEAGASTAWVDGVNFFSATHPADLTTAGVNTWSNYSSGGSALTIATLKTETTAMQDARDENNEKIGADPDTILVPTELYEPTKFLLAQNLILQDSAAKDASAGVANPYATKFNLVHVPELSDANDWYLVDSKLRTSSGLPPWLSLRYTVPNPALELRIFDESSDHFKRTSNIRISSHIWHGFALGFPHAIRKVVGA